ncbi:copper chaperone PCu(A)C [Rhodospirillaceae bacterium SYSU D60014]|uniref:copper chaperone PCu(A)C n=1 Tax=Virgifigura deserti TaxID=2268457 RepID=UPI000E66B300
MRTRIAALALSLTLGFSAEVIGQEAHVGDLVVEDPWARATASPAMPGAAYLKVENHGAAADTLIAVASPVAERAELHRSEAEDGVMKMRSVEAIKVAPGAPVIFAPGGLHIMLHGLKQPLTEGSRFPLALTFEKAGSVTVEVVVRPLGAMGPVPGHSPEHSH